MRSGRSIMFLFCCLAAIATGCTGWAWGSAAHGQIPAQESSPTQTGDGIIDVAAGGFHSCSLRLDRTVWCQGRNSWGQLGTGDLEPVDGARQVGTHSDWRSITGGEVHTCGIRAIDELWCWGGYPHHEQNPDGTLITPNPPVEVGGDHSWQVVAPSAAHTCGILTDGTLMCWGLNPWGQVGTGTTDDVEAPTAIGDAHWISIAAGYYNNCAVRDDRTLWCWGSNSHPRPHSSPMTPTQLGVASDWATVAGREGHYCGLKTDRSLWCWGRNDDSQLGQGTGADGYFPLPVQVGSDTDWRQVDTAHGHTCATRLDWSLWCWGRNDEGEVGVGSLDEVSIPTLVDDERFWIEFELSDHFSVAVSVP